MTGPCDWYVNPFAYFPEDGTGKCEKEGTPQRSRRKKDGYTRVGFRCEEHRGEVNDQWEVDNGFDVSAWVTDRLEAFKSHGPMFGSHDALEAMGVLLIEMEHKSLLGSSSTGYREHIEAYTRALAKRFGSGVLPLTERLPRAKPEEFTAVLVDILNEVRDFLTSTRRPT